MLTEHQAAEMLGKLTAKQVEVLDLLARHLTTKEIARQLNLAPNTVDQRIAAVREKWGTPNRKVTVRQYAELQATTGKTTYGSGAVDEVALCAEHQDDVLPGDEMFNAAGLFLSGPDTDWQNAISANRPFGLQALDERFGMLGRFGLVFILAFVIAMTLAMALAIVDVLGRLL